MKLDKLARQLRRDISASPKKAAALGLMVLVALCLWGPMAWEWIATTVRQPRAVAGGGVILEDDPVDPVAQANKARQVFHWEKIRKQIAADPRMLPAAFQTSWHNPFRSPGAEDQATQAQIRSSLAGDVDPAIAGLTLSGVAVGSRLRLATISGKTYKEGEIVSPLNKDGEPSTVEFKLLRVDYHEVELERNGKTYKLELTRPTLAQGDEITGPRRD